MAGFKSPQKITSQPRRFSWPRKKTPNPALRQMAIRDPWMDLNRKAERKRIQVRAINKIVWEGHTIEFFPVLSHRRLWVATLNELWFDGKKVATSGGFCLWSRARATVEHEGRPISIEVRSSSRVGSLVNLNYELLVDGKTISRSIAKTRIQW